MAIIFHMNEFQDGGTAGRQDGRTGKQTRKAEDWQKREFDRYLDTSTDPNLYT